MIRTMVVALAGVVTVAAGASLASAEQHDPWNDRLGPVVALPEFGGAWVEETHGERVLHVWLTEPDATLADTVADLLRQADSDRYSADRTAVHKADFSHAELSEWGTKLMALPEVTMTSVDHQRNRLRVGVADVDSDAAAVRTRLEELGVPVGAVEIEQVTVRTLPETEPSGLLRWALVAGGLLAAAGVLAAVAAYQRRLRRSYREWREAIPNLAL